MKGWIISVRDRMSGDTSFKAYRKTKEELRKKVAKIKEKKAASRCSLEFCTPYEEADLLERVEIEIREDQVESLWPYRPVILSSGQGTLRVEVDREAEILRLTS